MLVYSETKRKFMEDMLSNKIDEIILNIFEIKLSRTTQKSEQDSRKNSMKYMETILYDSQIPDDSMVAIEYQLPQTSKRIDFILTGEDENHKESAIIIELKQRQNAQLTEKDGIVVTRFKNGETETSHPSYQAWSYATLLQGFNTTVYEDNINLYPCAYLHNCSDGNVIQNPFYHHYLEKAPVFLKDDAIKLRNFIKQFVKYGDKKNTMYRIEHGKIKPSKALADSLSSMLKGNQEFIMIDDQKVVYETALALTKKSNPGDKNILIVEGGPGTGKSVVAINLLVAITKLGLNTRYVTKNAAPRAVYESMLTGHISKSNFSNMFTGSGTFTETNPNVFDALLVDEAHRLNEKSGLFKNLGENQIKEIIRAANCSIFFIDEDQKVTLHDIGTKEEIEKRAGFYNVKTHYLNLSSQFRCDGSDGYLARLDDVLQIRDTANDFLDDIKYDFQIVDSPHTLRDMILEKNKIKNKARLVAGYCRDWVSKKDKNSYDIVIPEHDFAMRRNLASDGNLWITNPSAVNEIGCIHTCQGLEVDYIGVIVGDDFIIRNGKVITQPEKRAKTDQSIKGWKKLAKEDKEDALELVDRIIKNTYRTLMTRGMKGCYVYFTDKETEGYFREKLK